MTSFFLLNDRQDSLLKSQGSLFVEFIPTDGVFPQNVTIVA